MLQQIQPADAIRFALACHATPQLQEEAPSAPGSMTKPMCQLAPALQHVLVTTLHTAQ